MKKARLVVKTARGTASTWRWWCLPMVNLRFLTHSLLPRKFVGAKKRFFFPLFALTSKELTLLWCSATVCVWQSTVWWKILWLIFPDPHFITALRKSLAYVKFIHNQRKNCDAKNQKWWIYKFEKRKSGIWERREKNLCCVESVEGVRRVWDWESRENGERKSTLMMMELEKVFFSIKKQYGLVMYQFSFLISLRKKPF